MHIQFLISSVVSEVVSCKCMYRFIYSLYISYLYIYIFLIYISYLYISKFF